MAEAYDNEELWSQNTCKLTDIIEDIPTLVRVKEGIYGGNEATTFSQGDLIKIDACKPMTRVNAYLTQPGSNIKYEKYGQEISLPYHYNGRVQVQPMHGEYYKYKTVDDLITYFPKYIRVLGHVGFMDPNGKQQSLEATDTLELKAVRKNKAGASTSLRCVRQGKDVILPKSLRGIFQVLPDEEQQTIRDVVEKYKLPQCVRFIGSGVQEIMSKDIQEAIHNLTSYSGEMILTRKVDSAPVLFGHYKGMVGDASSRFTHRSAVVIPLDTPEIKDIDVQLPEYMDPCDYEIFLLKNFSQSSANPEFLDGALYVDFSKSSKVQFIPETAAPAIPPRRKHGDSKKTTLPATPPPVPTRPPRGEKSTDKVQKAAYKPTNYENCSQKKKSNVTNFCPEPTPVSTPKSGEPENPLTSESMDLCMLLSDAFTGGGDIYQEPTGEPGEAVALPTTEKKSKNIKKMLSHLVHKVRPEKKSDSGVGSELPSEEPEEEDQVLYDYIDIEKELPEVFAQVKKPIGTSKPVVKVSPNVHVTMPQKTSLDKDISNFSISELESVLIQCGMPELAKVCKAESVDGKLFCSFPVDILKKKPFNLSDWKITKLNEIISGWRPKT